MSFDKLFKVILKWDGIHLNELIYLGVIKEAHYSIIKW